MLLKTKRQDEYLKAMKLFYDKNDQLPPVSKLADIMGVHPNAAAEAIKRLESVGAIERNEVNKWRFRR